MENQLKMLNLKLKLNRKNKLLSNQKHSKKQILINNLNRINNKMVMKNNHKQNRIKIHQ